MKDAQTLKPDEILERIRNRSNKEHLIPYLQMYETEALWFSESDKLCDSMNANQKQRNFINDIIKNFDTPEDINNNIETAPSKRLEKIFRGYDKINDGQRIAESIGIEVMMQKCPGFKNWIESIIDMSNKLRGINQ
jgi:hypothetical protein